MLLAFLLVTYFVSDSEQFLTHAHENTLVLLGNITVSVATKQQQFDSTIYCNNHKLTFILDVQLAQTASLNMSNCYIELKQAKQMCDVLQNSHLFDVHIAAEASAFGAVHNSNLSVFSAIISAESLLASIITDSVLNYAVINGAGLATQLTNTKILNSVLGSAPSVMTDSVVFNSYAPIASNGFYKLVSGLQIEFQQYSGYEMAQKVAQVDYPQDIIALLVELLPKCPQNYIQAFEGCVYNGCAGGCSCQDFVCVCASGEDPQTNCAQLVSLKRYKLAEIAGWSLFAIFMLGAISAGIVFFFNEIRQFFAGCGSKNVKNVPITEMSMQQVVLQSATVTDLSSQLLRSEQK